jgi:hypothetical protein
MSSIIFDGDTFHGISVESRGVFTHETEDGLTRRTYAGQNKDGHACGLGVVTWCDGRKFYEERGPDGKRDGRQFTRMGHGDTYYSLYERGRRKEEVRMFGNGHYCSYNDVNCKRDDPRVLALIAQVAPVEVRPAAPAPHPPPSARHSPPSNRPMDQPARFAPAGAREDHGHRGAPARRTPSLVAVRHNPRPAAQQRTTTQ